MRKIFPIALILIILFCIFLAIHFQNDPTYILKDNKSIHKSFILSFKGAIISGYNKNMNRCPPNNPNLYHFFILNRSFNSTIRLWYNGDVGFYFQESKTPSQEFKFADQNQPIHFIGYFINPQLNTYRNMYYGNHDYGILTNLSDLTNDTAMALAYVFYNYDYARYYAEDQRLRQIKQENLTKITEAANELNTIMQSGPDPESPEIVAAQLRYYIIANYYGFPDPSARRILEDLENKTKANQIINPKNMESNNTINGSNNSGYTPFWHTVYSMIIFIVLGPIFILVERIKTELNKRKKYAAKEYFSYAFGFVLEAAGLVYFIARSPSNLFTLQSSVILQWLSIVLSIIGGICLAFKYDKSDEVEDQH